MALSLLLLLSFVGFLLGVNAITHFRRGLFLPMTSIFRLRVVGARVVPAGTQRHEVRSDPIEKTRHENSLNPVRLAGHQRLA